MQPIWGAGLSPALVHVNSKTQLKPKQAQKENSIPTTRVIKTISRHEACRQLKPMCPKITASHPPLRNRDYGKHLKSRLLYQCWIVLLSSHIHSFMPGINEFLEKGIERWLIPACRCEALGDAVFSFLNALFIISAAGTQLLLLLTHPPRQLLDSSSNIIPAQKALWKKCTLSLL